LARRLVERGTRFVSIFQRKWDQHKDLDAELRNVCGIVDQPIGALLKDLKRCGLLDSTLVVWGTEFGRTPLSQNSAPGEKAGRDHHPFGFSIWMAGGGIQGGRTVGATDEFGWGAVEDRVHVNDFHATLLHLFGVDHKRLTYRHKGVDLRLTDVAGNVVNKLLS
jgi:arylsulfatase A-like enzyme